MKPFIRQTLERHRLRLQELDALLSAPDVVQDMDRFRKLTREHAEAQDIADSFTRYLQCEADLAAAPPPHKRRGGGPEKPRGCESHWGSLGHPPANAAAAQRPGR